MRFMRSILFHVPLSIVTLGGACGTSGPRQPRAPIFFEDYADPLPDGPCRLQVSYDGGMEKLGKLKAIVLGVDRELTGKACGFRAKTACPSDARAFDFGQISLPVGVHQVQVGFHFLGESWDYDGLNFSIMSSASIDCREGATRVRIIGAVPAAGFYSWQTASASFSLDGPSRLMDPYRPASAVPAPNVAP